MAGITLTTNSHFTLWKTEPTESAFISYYLPGGFIAIASLVAYILPHDNAPARLSVSSGALVSATMFHANVRAKIPVVSYVTEIDKFLLVIYIIIFMGFMVTLNAILLRRKFHRPATAKNASTFLAYIVVPESVLLLLFFSPTGSHNNDGTVEKAFSAAWLVVTPFLLLGFNSVSYFLKGNASLKTATRYYRDAEAEVLTCIKGVHSPDEAPEVLMRKPMAAWNRHELQRWLHFTLRYAPQRLIGCGELLEEARMSGASLAGASAADFRALGMRWGDAEHLHKLKEQWLMGNLTVVGASLLGETEPGMPEDPSYLPMGDEEEPDTATSTDMVQLSHDTRVMSNESFEERSDEPSLAMYQMGQTSSRNVFESPRKSPTAQLLPKS